MFVRKTAEDLEKLYAALSDEEKAKFDDAHESTISEVEKAEENVEEKGADEQTLEDRVDESVAAQEKGDEDTQDAKDRVDEAVAEEEERKEDEEHHEESKEADEALIARVDSLEEMISDLSERLTSILDKLDTSDFGEKPAAPMTDAAEDTESPAMRAYFAKAPRR
jgi:hypothetical protein